MKTRIQQYLLLILFGALPASGPLHAGLLYVSEYVSSGSVLATYDISLSTPDEIAASKNILISGLNNPAGVVFDSSGNIYVASLGSSDVR